jgi:dienelactone hydrolase
MQTARITSQRTGAVCTVLALLAALTAVGQPAPAAAPAAAPEVCQVAAAGSFDGQPFSYTVQLLSTQPRHRRYRLTYPSPLQTALASNNTIPAEYYVPANLAAGEARRPAVMVLHILNGNYELERMLCTVLAENGVPAVMFFLPYYGERGGPEGRRALLDNLDLFTQCLDQALLDVRRTADVLAARPEVDPGRLGVSGISLGALVAAAACGVEPRLQRAELILGGGRLKEILASARETRGLRESLARLTPEQQARVDAALARVEPLSHVEALRRLAQGGRLMLINAAEDEVIPRACTVALADAVGMKDKVVWLPGMGHYTAMAALPQIIQDTVAFFATDLPPGVVPPPAPASEEVPPLQALVGMLQQIVLLLDRTPAPGRCHLVDVTATVTLPNQKPVDYHVAAVRGSGSQFRLTAAPVPEVGALALGNGVYPWLVSSNGTLFLGTQQHDPAASLGGMLDVQQLLKIRVVVGAALAMAAAPEAFAGYVQVADGPAVAGDRVLEFTLLPPRVKGGGSVRLRRDNLAPVEITFKVEGVEGTVSFRQWALDTIGSAELFREPVCATVMNVPQADLLHMFAAVFNFLMEKAQ